MLVNKFFKCMMSVFPTDISSSYIIFDAELIRFVEQFLCVPVSLNSKRRNNLLFSSCSSICLNIVPEEGCSSYDRISKCASILIIPRVASSPIYFRTPRIMSVSGFMTAAKNNRGYSFLLILWKLFHLVVVGLFRVRYPMY